MKFVFDVFCKMVYSEKSNNDICLVELLFPFYIEHIEVGLNLTLDSKRGVV